MDELEARRKGLEAEIEAAEEPKLVEIHPNVGDIYRKRVEQLAETLQSGDDDLRQAAGQLLRSLISKIVVTPNDKKGDATIELHGDLAAILQFSKGNSAALDRSMVLLVAGVGFEPTTFRL